MRRLVDTHIPRFRQTWQERTLRARPHTRARVCALTHCKMRVPAHPGISFEQRAHGWHATLPCRESPAQSIARGQPRGAPIGCQSAASVSPFHFGATAFAALYCHPVLQCYAHDVGHVGSAVCIISLGVWLCGDCVRARSLCAHQECSALQVPNVCERAGRPAHIVLQSWPCSGAHARASHNRAPFDPVQRDTAKP
jgi:hypothetical protein